MTFRSKISLVIFLVSLLPTLAVLVFSTYLLSSTLNKVGNSGFESSLQAADTLVEQTEEALGKILVSKLPNDYQTWRNPEDQEAWRKANNVDLAFWLGLDAVGLSASDSLPTNGLSFRTLLHEIDYPHTPLGGSRISHLEIDGKSLLIFSIKDTMFLGGCGIIMPPGYSQRGKNLAGSISNSASLGIYRAFSLKLLAVATVISIIVAVLLGLIISALISRQFAKPLEKLAFGARIIGAGNLDYRVSLAGHDEFSNLADSFNKMAEEIKDNQRRLLESERLAAWREVARRIAHEIKNPLTPIGIQLYRLREQLQALQPGEISDESLHTLDTMRSQLDILGDLAQHFSTFAREPELKRIPCALENIVGDAVNIFCKEKNLKIILNIQPGLPFLNLDPRMMQRAFVNLIKNSLEAMPAGAKIEITAKTADGFVNVILRDDGPGFPSEKLEKIDQPYITSKLTGTGLGLVIVKKIIEEHGGQIGFYNERGAVVEMRLPIL